MIMATKKAPKKPVKPEEPKKVKIDPQAGAHDAHLRGEVTVLVNHPDGYPVELTLHPRKREYIPLRYFDALRKIADTESSENVSGVLEAFQLCLNAEEYDLLLDNCTFNDLEQVVPVMFGADPS